MSSTSVGIPTLRVNEPSRDKELERWEEQELEKAMEQLRQENSKWEDRIKGRRYEVTRNSLANQGEKK